MKTVLIPLIILTLSITLNLFADPNEDLEDCTRMAQIEKISKKHLADYMTQCMLEMEKEGTTEAIINFCTEMAQDDKISKKHLADYVIKCISEMEHDASNDDEDASNGDEDEKR